MKRFPVILGVLDEEVPKASVMRERCSGSWHSPRWLNEDWLFRWRAHDQLGRQAQPDSFVAALRWVTEAEWSGID